MFFVFHICIGMIIKNNISWVDCAVSLCQSLLRIVYSLYYLNERLTYKISKFHIYISFMAYAGYPIISQSS